jgi:hypothetical protein
MVEKQGKRMGVEAHSSICPEAWKLQLDAWLDKAQEDGDVDKVAKDLIEDILPDGVIEDLAVAQYQEFGSKLLEQVHRQSSGRHHYT